MRELCPWYAVGVKHQHEQAVRSALEFKGFETWVPTYRAHRTWSDRVKALERPLFAGYVFCRFPFSERTKIFDTPGVTRVVAFGGKPAEINESEMIAIRAVIASNLPARPWPHLKAGDRVSIEHGPLRGIEGTVIRDRLKAHCGLCFVVGVQLLQRYIAVDLEPEMLAPLRAAAASAGN